MAVASSHGQGGMTGIVHPFFTQKTAQPESQNPKQTQANSPPQSSQETQSRNQPRLSSKHSSQTQQIQAISSCADEKVTGMMLNDPQNATNLHLEKGTTAKKISTEGTSSLDISNGDQDALEHAGPPRKRRKTTLRKGKALKEEISEKNNYNWHQQLLFAAQPPMKSGRSQEEPSSGEQTASALIDKVPKVISLQSIPKNSSSSPSSLPSQSTNGNAPRQDELGLRTQDIGEDINDQREQYEEPPKKILKLNGRGTLGSPTPKRHAEAKYKGSRTSKNKQNITDGGSDRKYMTIIKYGSDKASREVLATRIEAILNGSLAPNNSKGSLDVQVKPLGPSKATHPFFLGKLTRKPQLNPVLTSKPNMSSDSAGQLNMNPTKSTINPSRGEFLSQKSTTSNGFNSSVHKFGDKRIAKFPGAVGPLWPPRDMMHIRGVTSNTPLNISPRFALNFRHGRLKQKEYKLQILPNEDILSHVTHGLSAVRCDMSSKELGPPPKSIVLRIPERRVLTGNEIYRAVCSRLSPKSRRALVGQGVEGDEDETQAPQRVKKTIHGCLSRISLDFSDYLCPFDTGMCESMSWTHKYSPVSAEEVLQLGPEAIILRDWLRQLTVTLVESTADGGRNSSKTRSKKPEASRGKKKRRKKSELSAFIINSDEEADEMDELTDPEDFSFSGSHDPSLKRTVIRSGDLLEHPKNRKNTGKMTNAILISGPSGCGKTAAVYAVAKEMDFEVFEINPGGRRSGRDILEKVGDMTKNHLVNCPNHSQDSSNMSLIDEVATKMEIESGKQGRMDTFFKLQESRTNAIPIKMSKRKKGTKPKEADKPKRQQPKQSLILLEEVDILFEEDKQFWPTVLALIQQSKRPVIMTCNDESLIPMGDLSLHAILRFSPPPEALVVDYLLLMAGKEGHILQRRSVEALYRAKSSDLRASIAELDFWCQLAVGDTKGGLEWMLDRWPPGKDLNEKGERLRTTSTDTYQPGMGWLGRDFLIDNNGGVTSQVDELLLEGLDFWRFDLEDFHDALHLDEDAPTSDCIVSPEERLRKLEDFSLGSEVLSASDIFSLSTFRDENETLIDPTLPTLSERALLSFPEGRPLLQADVCPKYTTCSAQMTSASFSGAALVINTQIRKPMSTDVEEDAARTVMKLRGQPLKQGKLTRARISTAFDAIAEPPQQFPSPSSGRHPNAIDQNLAVLTEDVAPFVRSIVAFDIHLEEERLRLSNLLSQGGQGTIRKIRTTRASRAALEGGSKARTRRERWFSKRVNPATVLKTGGSQWQEAVSQLKDWKDNSDDEEDELQSSTPTSSGTSASSF
ncbi:MAG: hypothetical protein M1834_000474 [Cirrosporium novae-zelandiae]|nr:MAG: hypothetical protein M1834_000474 [Cirrosporium novae-zelandiae]